MPFILAVMGMKFHQIVNVHDALDTSCAVSAFIDMRK